MIGKVIAPGFVSGLRLVLPAPVVAVRFDLSRQSIAVLFFSLLIGMPALSLVGAIGAALTRGLGGIDVQVSLLVLLR